MERRGPIAQFPPGFHFVPTDGELICHYLRAKLDGNDMPFSAFNDVKLYDYHPADLVEKYKDYGEGRWFFFTPRSRKYPNGIRPNRTTSDGDGYWKATGTEKRIYRKGKLVGIRRSLVFYKGKAGSGEKTDWIMQEYTIKSTSQQQHRNSDRSMQLDTWVLCSIQKKRGADKRKRSPSGRGGRSSSRSPSPLMVPRTGGGGGCSGSPLNEEGQRYRLASPGCQVGVHQRGWDDLPSICNNQFVPENNAPLYALPCSMQDGRQSATSRRLLSAGFPSEAANSSLQFYSAEAMNSGLQVYPSEAANSSLRFFSAEAINSGLQVCAPEATNSSLRFYSAEAINSAQQVYPSEEANSSVQFYSAEAMDSARQVYPTMSSEHNFYSAMSSAQQFFLSRPPMNSAHQVYPSLPPMNSGEQIYPSSMALNSAEQVYPSGGTPMNSSEQVYPSLPAMTYGEQVYTSGTPMISADHEYQSATLPNSAQQVFPLVRTSVQDNPSESARSQVNQRSPNSALQGNSSEPTNTDSPLDLLDIEWLMQEDSIFFDGLPLELLDDQPQFPNLSEQYGGSQQALPGHGGSGLPPPTSDMPPNNDSMLQTGHHHLSEQYGGSQQALPGHGGTVLPPPTSDMPPNDDSKLQTGRHHHALYNPHISTLVN